MVAVSDRISRIPRFGDYTIFHPFERRNFPGMNISASIRYTTEDDWLIMRGEALKKKDGAGYAQYPANAEMLCEKKEYCGRSYSYGDKYIADSLLHTSHPGNPKTWLAAGINHHLTLVARQLRDLNAPAPKLQPPPRTSADAVAHDQKSFPFDLLRQSLRRNRRGR